MLVNKHCQISSLNNKSLFTWHCSANIVAPPSHSLLQQNFAILTAETYLLSPISYENNFDPCLGTSVTYSHCLPFLLLLCTKSFISLSTTLLLMFVLCLYNIPSSTILYNLSLESTYLRNSRPYMLLRFHLLARLILLYFKLQILPSVIKSRKKKFVCFSFKIILVTTRGSKL